MASGDALSWKQTFEPLRILGNLSYRDLLLDG
jgi:hypothetical protein